MRERKEVAKVQKKEGISVSNQHILSMVVLKRVANTTF